jgi:inhibitor of growth protein 4
MGQTKEQIKYVLGVPSHGYDRPNMDDDDSAMEKMKKDIEASQDNALSLCTEKVLLARQAYDLVLLFLSFRSSLVSSGLMIT